MIDSEEELSKAMQGVALGVSAALGAGGQASFTICTSDFFNFSGPCYATMIYSIGMNGSLGGSVGGSIKLQAKDPRFAWDWMIQAPGPTRDQIIDRIVQSYIKEPCGQYTQ